MHLAEVSSSDNLHNGHPSTLLRSVPVENERCGSGRTETFPVLQRSVNAGVQGQTFARNNNRFSRQPNAQNNFSRPTRKCFICKSDKHLKYCPQRSDRESGGKDQEKSKEKANVSMTDTNHAWLFVSAKFGQYAVDCLVDTGATLSLVSSMVWSTIIGTKTLDEFNREIISASGNVLDTKGKQKYVLTSIVSAVSWML